MNLIISTDIGSDPDDLFTILYLLSVGINIKIVFVTPGSPDQIAIVQFIKDQTGSSFDIYASMGGNIKPPGGIHQALLKKYKSKLYEYSPTFDDNDIIDKVLDKNPDTYFLEIGPPKVFGKYCSTSHKIIENFTMQGGFLPYNLHTFPAKKLDKFIGQSTVGTFNMNGCPEGTISIINSKNIVKRQFVGKNVCHTVVFDQDRFYGMAKPHNRAAELFMEGMKIYLDKHQNKKLHDPVAMLCMLKPEMGTWVRGRPFRERGKWGTLLDDNGDYVLADINREIFWETLSNWKV